MLKPMLLLSAAAVSLSACASMPDVTYTYYLPKSVTTLSVTQTLSCTQHSGQFIVLSSVAAPVMSYSANYDMHETLRTADLKGNLSDTDVTVAFYDDGRLKTVNATLTGQGETILKSAISLGTSLATFGVAAQEAHLDNLPAPPPPNPCKILADWVGDGKPATLTYTMSVSLDKADTGNVFTLDPAIGKGISVSDRKLYENLKAYLPTVIVSVAEKKKINPRVAAYDADKSRNVFDLNLQDVANVHLDFFTCEPGQCPDPNKPRWADNAVWAGAAAVLVPVVDGTTYPLAVPKGAAFGTGKIGLALSEAGAIQSLEYSTASGAAGVMNVAASAVTAATPASPTSPPPPPTQAPQNTAPNANGGPQPNPGGGPHP